MDQKKPQQGTQMPDKQRNDRNDKESGEPLQLDKEKQGGEEHQAGQQHGGQHQGGGQGGQHQGGGQQGGQRPGGTPNR